MNNVALIITLFKQSAVREIVNILDSHNYHYSQHSHTLTVPLESNIELAALRHTLKLSLYGYKTAKFLLVGGENIFPVDSIQIASGGLCSDFPLISLEDAFFAAWNFAKKSRLDSLLEDEYLNGLSEMIEQTGIARERHSRLERDRDDRCFRDDRRGLEDHRDLSFNLGADTDRRDAVFGRGYRPSHRNEEDVRGQQPRVDLSGRHPLSFPDRSSQRTVTERPLNPVLPFSKRGKTISEKVTSGGAAMGYVGLDHFTTENVWVETVPCNGNNLGSKFVLHIDEDTMDLEFNDSSITFKGLDNWLMHNATEYGNTAFEELIIELALGNLGKEYDKDLCNIVINKPDVILELKQETATSDDAGDDKTNLTDLEPTIKLIGRDINAKTWRVNLLTEVFTATLESENVISFEKLDEYLHCHCPQYGTNEFYYRVVRKALQQMNVSTEHMQLLNFISQDGNLVVTSPTEFVMTEKLVDRQEANHVKTEVAPLKGIENVAHMPTTNPASKEVPEQSPSAPHNITSTQWNDILVHGNAAFANSDMRKSVDARVVMGVLFLREQEVVSPVDWKVEGGYLLLNVHRVHDLSVYRKGNYVNAIMNAMELEKADIADLNYGENVIRVKLASVKLHTKVTTQYLHVYNITSDGSDNDGDTILAEQPAKEEQPELPGLPKPVYKLTACDIVETIQELDDCVKAEVGVIEYHQFMDRQVTVKLIDDGGVKNSIIIDGMLDGDAKRKRQYVHGATVNALGSIMSDLFVGMELEGKVWVVSTRGNSIVLRNYAELTNIPETWHELPNDADYDDLVHALKG